MLIVSPFDDDGEDDQVAAVLEADDASTIPMPGELPGLTIVHSADEDAAVLLADEVPVPEGDNVYELWAIRGGTPESFATFRPDDDGRLSVYAAGPRPGQRRRSGRSPRSRPAAHRPASPTSDILNATSA